MSGIESGTLFIYLPTMKKAPLYFTILTLFISMLSFSKLLLDCNTKWSVQGSSTLVINGTTNVNSFECLSVNYEGEDTITEKCNDSTGVRTYNGRIVMQSTGFDCHHPIMTRDFKKTLDADKFPEIIIQFIDLETNPVLYDETQLFGTVEITMAGKSKQYEIACTVSLDEKGNKYLNGSQLFTFSEFGLDRPQKFFGAIKVRDEVSVDFHLKMDAI